MSDLLSLGDTVPEVGCQPVGPLVPMLLSVDALDGSDLEETSTLGTDTPCARGRLFIADATRISDIHASFGSLGRLIICDEDFDHPGPFAGAGLLLTMSLLFTG